MPEHYEIVTTAQVEQTWRVEVDEGLSAEDGAKQAEKRLRGFLTDPGASREGVVTLAGEKSQTTQRRVGKATKVETKRAEPKKTAETKPKAPEKPGDVT